MSKQAKTGLVFFSFASHPKGYYDTLFSRLQNQAKRQGLDLQRGSLKDLKFRLGADVFQITETRTGRDLRDFDVIYFELWSKAPQQALAASSYLKHYGVPFLGSTVQLIQPDTKLGEISILKCAGLPIPETVSSSCRILKQWFRQLPSLPFPLVVKNIQGYGGKLNFLVKSQLELERVLTAYPDTTFVVQEFIPNDRDYRFLVIDGRIAVVLERTRNGDTHLNNTSKGAKGRLLKAEDFSKSIQKTVIKSARVMGRLEFAGVDLVLHRDTERPYILEVNKTPQIEIGSHTDAKMAALSAYLVKLSRRKGKI